MESLTTKEKQLLKKLRGSEVQAPAEQLQNWSTVMSLREALSIPKTSLKISSGKAKALYLELPNGNRIYKSTNKSNDQVLENLSKAQVWEVEVEFVSSTSGQTLPKGLQMIIVPSSGKDEVIDLEDYL